MAVQPEQRIETLREACAMLAREEAVQVRDVAVALGLSRAHFQRLFKRHLGVTPGQYRRRVRAEAGRSALGGAASVTETIYQAGYSSSSRFYEGVGRELGMRPDIARRGGPGETIGFTTSRCSLGHLLVAWTDKGICAVSLGDDRDDLVAELGDRFPKAALEAAEECAWTRDLVDAVDHGSSVDLPLDIRGTAFQERVWQALRTIPRGQTRTYSEVAEAIGAPYAVRAVASACAKNSLAVLVPCHRVIRRDGTASGYRWGLRRKEALLAREAEAVENR